MHKSASTLVALHNIFLFRSYFLLRSIFLSDVPSLVRRETSTQLIMAIEEKNTVTTGVRSRENLNVDRVQTSPPASKNLSELEHDEANTGEFPQDASHRRAHIRRRLTHKFHHPAPLVEWTKFMHSETKNREPSLCVRKMHWTDCQQIWWQFWANLLELLCFSSSLSVEPRLRTLTALPLDRRPSPIQAHFCISHFRSDSV